MTQPFSYLHDLIGSPFLGEHTHQSGALLRICSGGRDFQTLIVNVVLNGLVTLEGRGIENLGKTFIRKIVVLPVPDTEGAIAAGLRQAEHQFGLDVSSPDNWCIMIFFTLASLSSCD